MTNEKRLELAAQLAAGIYSHMEISITSHRVAGIAWDTLEALEEEQAKRPGTEIDAEYLDSEDIAAMEEVIAFLGAGDHDNLGDKHAMAIGRVISFLTPRNEYADGKAGQ